MLTEAQQKTYEALVAALAGDDGGRFEVLGMPEGATGPYHVSVGSPFIYLDGDHMTFYVEPRRDGKPGYRLSDSSDTVASMKFLRGLESDLSPVQDRRFKEVLGKFGAWVDDIGFDDGELHMTVGHDHLGFSIAHFAQLQVRLSTICMFDN